MSAVSRLRELEAAATPGPWAVGEIAEGGVNLTDAPIGGAKIAPGECIWCRNRRVAGNEYIDQAILADRGDHHLHHTRTDSSVLSLSELKDVVGFVPDYSNSYGGIVSDNGHDAELIAESRNLLAKLLDVAEAALVIDEQSWHWAACGPAGQRLTEALRRLEEQTS